MGLRNDHIRHSAKVTRTARWKVLRMSILERDGFVCRSCGARSRLEVDHIKPVRTHPELGYEPTNLQALCASCHTRKTRIECGHPEQAPERKDWAAAVAALERNGRRFSIPDNLGHSAIPVELVCGPPGAGKSTYVRGAVRDGDTIIDFDDHLAVVGARKWDTDRTLIRAAFKSRDAAIRGLANKRSGKAFLIVTAPTKAERRAWRIALGRAVERVLPVDPETCKARIRGDPERAHAIERMCDAVDQWWKIYRAESGPTSSNTGEKNA